MEASLEIENSESPFVQPEESKSKSLKHQHKLLLVVFSVVIILLGIVIYLLLTWVEFDAKQQSNNQIVADEKPLKKEGISSELNKISLLKSEDLDTITRGAALEFIPAEEISLGYGSPSYDFEFYGLELSEKQHQNFLDYAHPSSSYSGSGSTINESPKWMAKFVSDEELYLSYGGFVCLTPLNYGAFLCSAEGSCLHPAFKGVKCAYVKDPSENNLSKVSLFMEDVLKDANIDCGSNCEIKDQGLSPIFIPEYSRKTIYFASLGVEDNEKYIALAQDEAEKSVKYFSEADWEVDKADITEKEKGWDKGTVVSVEVAASSSHFKCLHTITVSDVGGARLTGQFHKREMIECSINFFDK